MSRRIQALPTGKNSRALYRRPSEKPRNGWLYAKTQRLYSAALHDKGQSAYHRVFPFDCSRAFRRPSEKRPAYIFPKEQA
ncbi:hypothetical protein HMPREF9120_01408 [Neisseria sp. oral taxon 020 str. F0370]|nr:hypothetical protein HMPREF9120_01408 [Neisseria sp. oral taxon 020 str. F0370]